MENRMSNDLIMSVSGVRGIVPLSFTQELCAALAFIQTNFCGSGPMVVARDTRPSGEVLAGAVIRGITAAGATAIDIGVAPTPTACVAVEHLGAAGGIILTASHNPLPYNGYKMIHHSGRLFTGNECEQIYSKYRAGELPALERIMAHSPRPDQTTDAAQAHIDRIIAQLDVEAIRKARLRIGVDLINGAATMVVPRLLDALGVQWTGINDQPTGLFAHNPEPRPEHLLELRQLLADGGFHAGFAFDPDADRLITMGEYGEAISEEMTLVLGLQNLLSKKPTDIATNLSTSMVVDDVAAKYGVRVVRTKIGEANVVEGMATHGCGVGGEGNGGVIFPPISTVRDGLAGIALVLELMAQTGKTINSLAGQWPAYAMIKEKIPLQGRDPSSVVNILVKRFSSEKLDLQDGVKIIRNNGWVHLRGSNTEPIMRCYAEAASEEQAKALVSMITDALRM